jgi:hypothetical protein
MCLADISNKTRVKTDTCTKCNKKLYYLSIKDRLSITNKEKYQDNSISIKTKKKDFYVKNQDKLKLKFKEYRELNVEKIKNQQRNYRINNKEKINSSSKERRDSDSLYRLRCNIHSLVYLSLKRRRISKNTITGKLIGCSFEELQEHLINTAIQNYGFYDSNFTYHIDHIYPCSLAKNKEELIKLQYYTNLQYLTPEDNLKKGSKYVNA